MKTFKEICTLNEKGLKLYMTNILKTMRYEPVNENGFLYAKGEIPVLLVAHLDTVHATLPTQIREDKDGRISSPQGIGGDDRCGVYMIQEIVKELKCSVLLCEQEEVGCIGASKFANSKYIDKLDVNYMVELDRNGKNDAVFYECDNEDFTKFVLKNTGYKKQPGSFTDICKLMPKAKIAGVNLSCGYYSAHTTNEYVVPAEMNNTIEVVKKLVQTQVNEAFEYIERKRTSYFDNWYKTYNQQSMLADKNSITKKKKLPTELTLVVCVDDDWNGSEVEIESHGSSANECWANFFFENPGICYSMVFDYYWM